ncbi:MAG: diguanylate cyclase, partial [Candidatus Omnitrophica bacterium]|nr:diguanylate cyclase [Candidatus Omnitrophota bacterium]
IRFTLGKVKVWLQRPERKLNTRGIAGGVAFLQSSDQTKTQLTNELVSLRLYIKNMEARDGLLFDRNPAFGIIINSNGRIEDVNKTFLSNLQYSKNEVIGYPAVNFVIEKQKVSFLVQTEKNPITGEFAEFEASLYAKDRTVRTLLFVSSQPLFQEEGKPLKILLAGVDITSRKKAEEVLERLEEDTRLKGRKLEDVLNIDQEISSILDLNHLIDVVIEKATEILGAQRCSLMLLDVESQELLIKGARGLSENIMKETRVKVGESIAGLVARDFKPILVQDIETDKIVARRNKPFYKSRSFLSVPIELQKKIVGVVNVTDKGPLGDGVFTQADLKILCMIVHQAAISIENASHCKDLERLSTIDSLTGIYNRRHFMLTLKYEIERSRRYGNQMCLLMFDVDDFKSYNDDYGHLEGDQVLKEISLVIKINLRTADTICRYAGDEFVIILPETNILQAEVIAKKFKQAVKCLRLKRAVTLSLGIAAYHKNYDERNLILKADQALYQSKKEGKDTACCLP